VVADRVTFAWTIACRNVRAGGRGIQLERKVRAHIKEPGTNRFDRVTTHRSTVHKSTLFVDLQVDI
jgi:hypothetical protein